MDKLTKVFDDSKKYFPTPIQEFQFLDKYSRFDYDKGRRETWIETVDRSVEYLKEISKSKLPQEEYDRIRKYILEMKATPSMRLLAMAGPAARRQNISIYNCSYLPLDSIDSFVEELIIAMAGCGVGFSVERRYIEQLPEVKMQTGDILSTYQIQDSTEGWAEALRVGLTTWFEGKNLKFDYSLIRPAGTPLKIKGGRSSGPEPFKELLEFARRIILARQGKKLRPIDAHDIACKIGYAIVSGGVRRTALISLFDIEDEEMRHCKEGDLDKTGNTQRYKANNSAVWPGGVTQEQILTQMYDMIKGQVGEPGIFVRHNANKIKPDRRREATYGTNPCGEIHLRPYEFCNLTIAVARHDDTIATLKEKIEVATIIGTIQSMATHFPGLRNIWKENCEEERLLGVDINGWHDCPVLKQSNPDLPKILKSLRDHAVATNKKYAELLGVNQSVAVTCVKPSGNSSQLFNCSSGLHARHSKYYIRNIRVQAQSPLRRLMQDQGVPMHPESWETVENATTYVVHFPVESPNGTVLRDDLSAIDQLEYWLLAKLNWTEHNPSVTITYRPHEVIDVIKWVADHKEVIGGLSFMPFSDAKYEQMPYEALTEEAYLEAVAKFPKIDFSKLPEYEQEDFTSAAQELACVNNLCEIEDYRDNHLEAVIGSPTLQ